MGKVSVPPSMAGWCSGLYDCGLVHCSSVKSLGTRQVHITVTKPGSAAGQGLHISVYTPAGGLIGAGSYSPDTAVAKLYFHKVAGAMVEKIAWHKSPEIVRNLTGFASIQNEAIEFYYETYPTERPKAAFVPFTAADKTPSGKPVDLSGPSPWAGKKSFADMVRQKS